MQKSERALPVIVMAIFLDLVVDGILVPILPQLLANPGSKFYLLPEAFPVSSAYVILGLLIAVFPICMFFATPILGEYSDYVGRKKVMLLSLFGSATGLAIFAIGVASRSLTLLFIGRIIGGITAGNISVCQASIADITPPEKRAARFGLVGAAYGVGFILGPVIGGVLSESSIVSWFTAWTPFMFASLIALINAGLVFIFMTETRDLVAQKAKIIWHKAIGHIVHAYNMRHIRTVFTTNFLFQGGIALFATFFAVFLTYQFGFSQLHVGYFIAYSGIWVIISQSALLRILTKRFDEVTLLRTFLLLGAGSVFLYYVTESTISLLIVGAVFALTNGISMATIPSLVSRRAPAESQGEILGINASVQALAQTIPPILAGILAAKITPSAPIYAAGAVIGAGWLWFVLTVKKEA